ncbi:Cell wall protein RHD3 [Candida viswanathii]|uniref:Cell wall protein RHD3 n=1 Tax=Candida viswanathii TaxID=5486 RepID=A0A367Y3P9_9ASCO|nr:Cell wall protein RHD3 [Candida viswanathii]
MKFLSILPLASAALAAISEITLRLRSEQLGVSSIHEGAAVNYLFLGSEGIDLYYDSDAKSIFQVLETATLAVPINFTVYGGVYQMTPEEHPSLLRLQMMASLSLKRSFFLIDHESNGTIPVKLYAKLTDDETTAPPSDDTTSDTASITSFEGGAARASYGAAGLAALVAGLLI